MLKANTRIATTNGERYAIQLCKHFRHKVTADYADRIGDVDFKFAKAKLVASDDAIEMSCEADDVVNLGRAKYVLEDHLLRFSWREQLQPIAWDGPETPAPPVPPGRGEHKD